MERLDKSIEKLRSIATKTRTKNSIKTKDIMSQSCYGALPIKSITTFPIEKYDNVPEYPIDRILNELNFDDENYNPNTIQKYYFL